MDTLSYSYISLTSYGKDLFIVTCWVWIEFDIIQTLG